MPVAKSKEPHLLTRELLAHQRDLSAVAQFARWHEQQPSGPASKAYRDLIPLTAPGSGQQYAFDVDLDRCSGCKACVSACHSLNGLDDGESWRDTGLIVSDDWRHPFQQVVTTACHHCVDPACLEGCPVLAYDKDPVTGIVRHLDDQCIGCQYCVMKCPYDVPKYSTRLGIVRKCDMCSSRLAVGEAPACAQACPGEAIKITVVDQAKVRGRYRTAGDLAALGIGRKSTMPSDNVFLPSSPDPAITLPATRYRTARTLPEDLRAADRGELKTEPPHWPLVFMLVLTQSSVGMFAGALVLSRWHADAGVTRFDRAQTLLALGIGMAGLLASVLHLGRPMGAWRAFLGLRTSWLSREIVGFGGFGFCAMLCAGLTWVDSGFPPIVRLLAGAATVFAGFANVFCSAMVYADTRRDYWSLSITGGKFLGTTLLLGGAGTLMVLAATTSQPPRLTVGCVALFTALAGMFKLAVDRRVLDRLADDDYSPLHKTALLLSDRLGHLNRIRTACGWVGAVVLPLWMALQTGADANGLHDGGRLLFLVHAFLSLALCVIGEVTERRLFFIAVQPVRMPGSFAS